MLSLTVAEGSDPSEPWAGLSGHPRACIPDDANLPVPEGEEVWMYLDPVLNNVMGYNMTADTLAETIWHGPQGIHGVVTWLCACLDDIGIGEALLEGKMQRLGDALVLW